MKFISQSWKVSLKSNAMIIRTTTEGVAILFLPILAKYFHLQVHLL